MGIDLDGLLDDIDPSNTIDSLQRDLDEALNSFDEYDRPIEDVEDFENCLARFFRHIDNGVLRLHFSYDKWPQEDLRRCLELVWREFPNQGLYTAHTMARTSVDGGLYAVMKRIATRLVTEYSNNQIGFLVSEFLNGLSSEERREAAREYAERFGHLLAPDWTENDGALINALFPKVLAQHPHMIRQLRRSAG